MWLAVAVHCFLHTSIHSNAWPVSLTNSSEQLSLTKKNRTKIVLNNALLPWRQLPNLPTEHLNNLTWQFRAFAYLTIVQLNIYLIEHWAIEHLSIQHWFTEFRKWSQLTKYIIEQCTIEHFRVPIKADSDSNTELSLILPIPHRSIEHFQSNNSSTRKTLARSLVSHQFLAAQI